MYLSTFVMQYLYCMLCTGFCNIAKSCKCLTPVELRIPSQNWYVVYTNVLSLVITKDFILVWLLSWLLALVFKYSLRELKDSHIINFKPCVFSRQMGILKHLYPGLSRGKSYFFQDPDYFSNIYALPQCSWLTATCCKP